MYTTFSVVESIPPLTSRRRHPVSFSSSPVVAVSLSPPVVIQLTRSIQYIHARQFTHAQSSSREATYVHAQFTAHEEHPSSRPTHLTLRPYRSTDFVQYLSQTTAEILAPPFAQHTPRELLIRFSDHQVFLQRSSSGPCQCVLGLSRSHLLSLQTLMCYFDTEVNFLAQSSPVSSLLTRTFHGDSRSTYQGLAKGPL